MAFSTFNSFQTFIMYVRASVSSLSYIYNFPALDPSLVLYYPMDSSANVGGGFKTANFASQLPVYDASMAGSSMITYALNNTITSFGDLSLNNTMGSQLVAQTTSGNYVVANNTFAPNISGGFSISLWFSCSGQLNKTGTLISLPLNKTGNGLEIDISGTNMIYTGYVEGGPTTNGLSLYFPFNTNGTDTVSSLALAMGSSTINTSIKKVGAGSLDTRSGPNWPVNSNAGTALAFLTSPSAVTITHWIYITGYAPSSEYNMYWNISNGATYGFYLCTGNSGVSGNLSFYITLNSGGGFLFNIINGILVPLNTWTHIAYVFTNNGAKLSIYVNGSVISTANNITVSNPPFNGVSTYNLISFGTQTGGNIPAPGLIDDFRIYNRALTTTEITTIYNYTG